MILPARTALASLAAVLLLAACAGPGMLLVEPTQPVDPNAQPIDGERPTLEATAPTSKLTRDEVDVFLANGPHWFIRQVDVVPARVGDHFAGFRIVHFFAATRRFRRVDLRPGDVVIRVNDLPIGRPEQFMKVWEDLKVAKELTVEYVRGGSVRLLRWEIDDPGSIEPTVITSDG
jgi:type II secretory pathway component PulC